MRPETSWGAVRKGFVRDNLLQEKDWLQQGPERIPLILTYNRFLLNLPAVVSKNWNILQTD